METTTQIIEDILDMELEMFQAVPSDGNSNCQNHPEAFKFHRRLQFSIWSIETLSCYHEDLRRARQNGENFMTIKYARMQGLIPPRNTNSLIDSIVRIKMNWQAAMVRRYPAIMGRTMPLSNSSDHEWMTSFETYARGELETYSDATLAALHADLQDLLARNINASERIYQLQAESSGFASLEDAEIYMQKKNPTKENRNEK